MPPQKFISTMQAAASSTTKAKANLKRIAVFGGSFDPPTVSHLQVSFWLSALQEKALFCF